MKTITQKAIGEETLLETLPNGLRVAVSVKPGFSKAMGLYATKYGSVDRVFGTNGETYTAPDGVAHFLEHKLFEGDQVKVFDQFSKVGAYCNAATSFRTTHYYFTTSGDFSACFDILLNFVQHPVLTEERVEKEKGIIEQEVRMYEDNPDWRGFFNLLKCLYQKHPVQIPVGGTVETVHATTLKDLETCYQSFYRPENMYLIATGDIDPEKVFAAAREKVVTPPGNLASRRNPPEPAAIHKKSLAENMPVSRPRVLIGYREMEDVAEGPDWLRRDLVTGLLLELLFGKSSATYLDLYRRGVIDDSFSTSYTGETDYGFTILGGEADDPEAFLGEIHKAVEQAQEKGFSPEDFERLRKKAFGFALKQYDSPEGVASSLMSELVHGVDPYSWLDLIQQVDLDAVMERLRSHFQESARAHSVILPAGG